MLHKYTLEDVARVFPECKDYGEEVCVRVCPNCADDRYKFWVNIKKGVGHCFICGYSPRMETLLGVIRFANTEELGFKEIFKEDAPEPLPPTTSFYDLDIDHPVFAWLSERRLVPAVLSDYGVRYCHRGRHWKRIIFPFFGPRGDYRGFQGRYAAADLPRHLPKWTTGKGTKKSHMLWNFERVLQRQNWCVLVEGIFDALRMRDCAVAMFGKQPSEEQKQLLEYFSQIYIMLDSDATDMAYEISQDLVSDSAFRVMVVPLDKGDPDEYEEEELFEKIIGVGGNISLP
jgi:DNA primase